MEKQLLHVQQIISCTYVSRERQRKQKEISDKSNTVIEKVSKCKETTQR